MTVRRILVPVDFSPGSHDAARHARAIAREFGSAIHVVHAVAAHDAHDWELNLRRAVRTSCESEQAHAVHRLAAFIVSERLDPFRTTGIVRVGPPDEVIAQYADEIDADLIVIGMHGDEDAAPGVGQVAARILGRATRAVLTVPASGIAELETADLAESLALAG